MGASYTHTNRPTGTVITDTIYNGDHQNHIDNAIPALFDDYSASVSQMKSNTDPGGVGSESLATSLAGDLERIRFVLKRMGGGAEWYDSPVTRVENLHWFGRNPSTGAATDSIALLDGIATNMHTFWRVPEACVLGSITFSVWRQGGATNTAVMRVDVNRYRDATAPTVLASNANVDFTPGDTNVHKLDYVQIGGNFVVGDILEFAIKRLGSDGGDTMTANVNILGMAVSFSSIAGRP